MGIQKFEDIIAWQKAQVLAIEIYKIFNSQKDFGFKDQICRASVSEGFDRSSNAEFVRFLYIAAGSCSEVKSMLYLAEKLNYINSNQKEELINNCNEISKIIRGLINVLNTKK